MNRGWNGSGTKDCSVQDVAVGLAPDGFLHPSRLVTGHPQPNDDFLQYFLVGQDSHLSMMASMSAQVTLDSFAPVAAYC